MGTGGVGSPSLPRACQAADRRDPEEGTPFKGTLFCVRFVQIPEWEMTHNKPLEPFFSKSPAEIQYVGVLSIAAMQAFSETKFEYSTVTNWVYNCSTADLKANGSNPLLPIHTSLSLLPSGQAFWGIRNRQLCLNFQPTGPGAPVRETPPSSLLPPIICLSI